jgi:hypothetical protein
MQTVEKLFNSGPMGTRIPRPPSAAKPALINAGVQGQR